MEKMAKHILKCTKCSQYTMKDVCPACGAKTSTPSPGKYSPEDPYGKYRREARREKLSENGLI